VAAGLPLFDMAVAATAAEMIGHVLLERRIELAFALGRRPDYGGLSPPSLVGCPPGWEEQL